MAKHPLRKAARGKPCMIRLWSYEIHSHDPATVTLHHIRNKRLFGGDVGLGQKPNDIFGVWACDKCHTILHNPPSDRDADMLELEELQAMVRTQHQLIKEGLI